MSPCQSLLTSVNLLRSVSSGHDSLDWERFVAKYVVLLRAWATRWGASPELVDDMVQETLLNVLRSIPEFQYNPSGSFRSWLKLVAWRTWRHIQRREMAQAAAKTKVQQGFASTVSLSQQIACRDHLFDLFEKMASQEIFEMACDRVRPHFSESSWQAFQMMEMEHRPGDETAATLGLSIPAVHAAVYRVRKQIIDAVRQLDQL